MTLVPEQLSTNALLEILVLAFMLVDTIAWLMPEVMRYQMGLVFETRSERMFVQDRSKHYLMRGLLLLQFFLFFGLHLFLLIAGNPTEQLAHPTPEVWHTLLKCVSLPFGWYVVQQVLYIWWSTVFSSTGKSAIMNRVYQAIHMLSSPLVMVIFLIEMIGLIEVETATILLSLTFIIIQITFVFSGIKIFVVNWSTMCFLFLYLCTLEIAPLVMIYQLLTR